MADKKPTRRDPRTTRGAARQAGKPTAEEALSTRSWTDRPEHLTGDLDPEVVLECGWGRLIFGQTFADLEQLTDVLGDEEPGRRDICLYVREPHVLVSMAPQELFIDPSHTYRLWLHHYRPRQDPIRGVTVRELRDESDADEVNRIYTSAGMVVAPTDVMWDNQRTRTFVYLVATDEDGDVVGTITGVDHAEAFNDPEDGSSLWCLAVDPQTTLPSVGEALVRTLAERMKARGRAYLDLSVMHDNTPAIGLYEKLGFQRVPVFCVKRKNPINEQLFSPPSAGGIEDLNPYARVIVDEALRRGIAVDVVDAAAGFLKLSHGGREVLTRESLSELTTAVAMSMCDDKRVTRRILADTGLRVPRGRSASFDADDRGFLDEVGELVVKPARGEQGQGITVGVRKPEELEDAIDLARSFCPDVLLEEHVDGDDLRIVVIDHEVVAAAVRRPARVVGTGDRSIERLIRSLSRRRAAATDGEAAIPMDDLTEAAVSDAGFDLDDVLPEGEEVEVRKTANLHTGGTIHDVTEDLHPELAEAARTASRALDIPVVGLDLIVPEVDGTDYVMIEANERPGLANHEPQPTAERFIDLLFPSTQALPTGWDPAQSGRGRDHKL
ncbi:MAG: N-acetylglutaminylglutamine synthetase [Nitriliruptorales bacterium]|nr:N-acetylglutaminylglutamine synthetase [Nitriliruptorales bacterium]